MAITPLLGNDAERCFIAEDLRLTEAVEEVNAASNKALLLHRRQVCAEVPDRSHGDVDVVSCYQAGSMAVNNKSLFHVSIS